MVDIGILEEINASKWELLCLIVAKNGGLVTQISDLCLLNKCMKQKISVAYNLQHFERQLGIKNKYKYQPMDLKCAPDFAQQLMEQVLWVLSNIKVDLDGIGIFSKAWEEHLLVLGKVFSHLEANGFTILLSDIHKEKGYSYS